MRRLLAVGLGTVTFTAWPFRIFNKKKKEKKKTSLTVELGRTEPKMIKQLPSVPLWLSEKPQRTLLKTQAHGTLFASVLPGRAAGKWLGIQRCNRQPAVFQHEEDEHPTTVTDHPLSPCPRLSHYP